MSDLKVGDFVVVRYAAQRKKDKDVTVGICRVVEVTDTYILAGSSKYDPETGKRLKGSVKGAYIIKIDDIGELEIW